MAVKIKSGETILFIGDSITDCGRRGPERPLGSGYVKFFSDFLIAREPQKNIEIINKGIGGDNVLGLRNRWADDVLRFKPNWLSIKIGINDLHVYLRDQQNGITPKKYEEAYNDILSQTRKALPKCKIMLIEPFFISQERSKTSFRRDVLNTLPKYIRVVRAMQRKYKTRLVKTHDMYQALLKYYPADTFCPEPVHPNPTGHIALAEEVYKTLSR